MNDIARKTIASGLTLTLPVYLAEELVLGHPAEPHAAEKMVDTTPIFTQTTALSGSVTPYSGSVNFVYNDQSSYHQTA